MRMPPKVKEEMVSTYEDIVDRMEYISDLDQEVIFVITLDDQDRVINDHIVAIGKIDECEFDATIFFQRVISDKSRKFVMGHNHPNGAGTFSYGDLVLTLKIKYMAWLLGVIMVDHILFPHKHKPIAISQRHQKIWSMEVEEEVDKYFLSLV